MKKVYWELDVLDSIHSRIKVIGGWIVHAQYKTEKGQTALSSCFVPDSNHEWFVLTLIWRVWEKEWEGEGWAN